MFNEQNEQPHGPLTPDEIREAFPDWKHTVTEKIHEYEAERETLEDETRFDLFCLPDLCPGRNEREWALAFIETGFNLDSKRIEKELRHLRSLLPVKRRTRRISPVDVDGARRVPCEELLGQPARRNRWHCPFHDDARPSFSVSSKNRWRCWSQCGISGDSIDLYMRLHNVDFISAVQSLIRGKAA